MYILDVDVNDNAWLVELVYTQNLKFCALMGLGDRSPHQAPIYFKWEYNSVG